MYDTEGAGVHIYSEYWPTAGMPSNNIIKNCVGGVSLQGRDYAAHKRLVRFTWPIWMYVSVTGVLVYLMLYHLAPVLHA